MAANVNPELKCWADLHIFSSRRRTFNPNRLKYFNASHDASQCQQSGLGKMEKGSLGAKIAPQILPS